MESDASIARKIINKVKEFRANSMQKEELLRQLMDNPSAVNNEDVLKEVEKSAKIVKELFVLVDEFDMLEGNVPYLQDD